MTFVCLGSHSLGFPVSYWIHGSTHQETIVLIHGFNSSHDTWKTVIPSLYKRYRVVVYDQPGHGASKADGTDFSPSRMADELKLLMDTLKIENANIVGHSMGGRTAVAFGAKYPSMAKSVLVEDMGMNAVAEAAQVLPSVRERFSEIQKNVPDIFPNYADMLSTLSKYFSLEEIPWIVEAAQTTLDGTVQLGNRPEVTMLYLYEGLALDMGEELKSIKAPMTFFAADPKHSTAVLKGEAFDYVKKVRPDINVQVFEGASHSIHKKKAFSEALLRFLKSTI